MVDPWAAIADVSVGKQACHLISRLAPPRLRARILGCVDHDGVHATWRVGSCVARGRRTDGLSRLVSGRPTGDCGGTPKRAARYVRGAGGPATVPVVKAFRCECVIYRFTFRGVPGYRRDSFSAKLRRHGIPDTAVYGKGVRFVLRGFVTGVCVPAIRPHRRGMCAIGPGHATRQPSAGGTIPVLPRLPCPSFIIYIAAPPSLRVA
jgi:hypothetical protein